MKIKSRKRLGFWLLIGNLAYTGSILAMGKYYPKFSQTYDYNVGFVTSIILLAVALWLFYGDKEKKDDK